MVYRYTELYGENTAFRGNLSRWLTVVVRPIVQILEKSFVPPSLSRPPADLAPITKDTVQVLPPEPEVRLARAVHGLAAARPELSAAMPVWWWQRTAIGAVLMLAVVALIGGSDALRSTMPLLLAIPFAFVVVIRVAALGSFKGEARPAALPTDRTDTTLPRYTVLVPLVREAAVVAQLVNALRRLDYPADRHEILLITEAFDCDTRAAIDAVRLPAHFRVVVVPDGEPRTKPRALNYALPEAQGDFVVVYDAEDCPEPDQLLRAVAEFRRGPANLGCLQARLNIYNPGESWLTRQFTMEYTALFDAILPLLERWHLPVPLGGTSNHFPRAILEEAGGWDAFNVTEDADLGIRLARGGWHVGVLASTTWEEAPPLWKGWLAQRTRWLKGWQQTYLVHMREPRRLWQQLGPRRFIGFQALMAALLFSVLLHPWFYVFAIFDLAGGAPLFSAGASGVMWGIALFNLIAGYLSAVALGRAALRHRRHSIGAWIWWVPVYWLAISIAAYRAIFQLVAAPYHWEKTEHRGLAPDPPDRSAVEQVSTAG